MTSDLYLGSSLSIVTSSASYVSIPGLSLTVVCTASLPVSCRRLLAPFTNMNQGSNLFFF